ncbi:hypothetical protein B0H13DRAFT_1856802 [Mycena leptocephala]|nr:hypothetical protein B0H13DRAFT_1856802 [Mycena leptocephala]
MRCDLAVANGRQTESSKEEAARKKQEAGSKTQSSGVRVRQILQAEALARLAKEGFFTRAHYSTGTSGVGSRNAARPRLGELQVQTRTRTTDSDSLVFDRRDGTALDDLRASARCSKLSTLDSRLSTFASHRRRPRLGARGSARGSRDLGSSGACLPVDPENPVTQVAGTATRLRDRLALAAARTHNNLPGPWAVLPLALHGRGRRGRRAVASHLGWRLGTVAGSTGDWETGDSTVNCGPRVVATRLRGGNSTRLATVTRAATHASRMSKTKQDRTR